MSRRERLTLPSARVTARRVSPRAVPRAEGHRLATLLFFNMTLPEAVCYITANENYQNKKLREQTPSSLDLLDKFISIQQ